MSAHDASSGFRLPRPGVTPVLDPRFRPAALALRAFQQRARDSGRPVRARLALEQKDGAVSRFAVDLMPDGEPGAESNFAMLERLVKLELWARGGFRVHLDAPAGLVVELRDHFSDTEVGRFDMLLVHVVTRERSGLEDAGEVVRPHLIVSWPHAWPGQLRLHVPVIRDKRRAR